MKVKLKNKKNRIYYKSIHKLNKYNIIENDIIDSNSNYINNNYIDLVYMINLKKYYLCINSGKILIINYLKSLKQVKKRIHLYLSEK